MIKLMPGSSLWIREIRSEERFIIIRSRTLWQNLLLVIVADSKNFLLHTMHISVKWNIFAWVLHCNLLISGVARQQFGVEWNWVRSCERYQVRARSNKQLCLWWHFLLQDASIKHLEARYPNVQQVRTKVILETFILWERYYMFPFNIWSEKIFLLENINGNNICVMLQRERGVWWNLSDQCGGHEWRDVHLHSPRYTLDS